MNSNLDRASTRFAYAGCPDTHKSAASAEALLPTGFNAALAGYLDVIDGPFYRCDERPAVSSLLRPLTGRTVMSHHLDTPEAAERGQLFINDLFAFDGQGSTVLVLDVNSTVTGKHAEPDFWPGARYNLKVHLDGAEREGVTFRVTFGEADTGGGQAFQLHLLTGADAADDDADGELVVEGHTGHATGANSVQVWAGRAADPFYFDLSLLQPVSSSVTGGTALDLSKWRPAEAENTFGGTSVASIVVEVQHGYAGLSAGTRVDVWASTTLSDGAGGWRQINRGGRPMMWPIFWPDDTDFSNPANSRHPSADVAADGDAFAAMLTATAAANGATNPQAFGQAVAQELFPDVLPYEIGTLAVFSKDVRNGRALIDNAPEVMLSLVTGTAVPSGLTPAAAEAFRNSSFPYVVPA